MIEGKKNDQEKLLIDLINECTQTAQKNGFDLTMHNTQLFLFATELKEAIDKLTWSDNELLNNFIRRFMTLCNEFELYRKHAKNHTDNSKILPHDEDAYLEELADTQIKLWSYIGGNKFTESFLKALEAKMKKNKTRPYRHGKGF